MRLSVIVPAYKQSKTIVDDAKNILASLDRLNVDYELLVVIDGRVDDTEEKLKNANLPKVSVYAYEKNMGKGYALRYGSARATGEFVVFLDSGMEINPEGIKMLWEHMSWYNADIIIGSKRHPASKVAYPIFRRLTSFCYQFLTRILFGLNVRDTQTGLKMFRREVLEKVMPRLLVKRYAIDIEILAVANYLGFRRIFEAPVDVSYKFDDLTHASALKPIWRMLVDTLAVFYRLKFLRYYDDNSKKRWVYDSNLDMKVNIG